MSVAGCLADSWRAGKEDTGKGKAVTGERRELLQLKDKDSLSYSGFTSTSWCENTTERAPAAQDVPLLRVVSLCPCLFHQVSLR